MDIFSLTCTTCKSRLKVRDEAAIGQILACPKCGGMVMVRRPEEAPSQLTAHSQDSQVTATGTLEMSRPGWDRTRGDSAFDDVDELLGDAPPRQKPSGDALPEAGSGARPRFVGAPPAAASPPQKASDDRAVAALAAAAASLAPPPPGEEDALALPPADWAAGQPWRYWLLMVGSVAVGVVVAFVAVSASIYFLRGDPRGGGQSKVTASSPVGAPQTSIGDEAAEVSAADDSAGDRATVRSPPGADMPANASPETQAQSVPSGDDPLGLNHEPDRPHVPQPANSDDPLAKFDLLIGGGEEDPLGPPSDAEAEREGPIPALDTAPASTAAQRPPPREVDVPARLADPLPGIETPGTPLADFLQLISDLSTIPITLEPDALAFARVTPDTPVVLRAANTTVGDALAAAIRPLGLEHVVADEHVIVRLAERTPSEAITHRVHDLTGGDEAQLTELVELLVALVEPGTWGAPEEDAPAALLTADPVAHVLTIQHRRAVQAQALVALEKLRSARGLPRVVPLDTSLFRLHTRSSRALARLETPISLNFQQPTRLVTILQRLGEAGDARIVVHWRDLAGAEWNPDADATLLADNQPLGEALDALLAPLDLAWRIVDGRTIEVVTRERLARHPELEVYPVGDLVADDPEGERLIANVVAALRLAGPDADAARPLYFDAEGGCLLAALPQPAQQALESLLGRWRSEREQPPAPR
jgi:predicted RNA-binding Zn-ribbon protein involved in translation (DUF1610 family)